MIAKDKTRQIKTRIPLADKGYYSVHPFLKSQCAHRKTKLRIYKIIITSGAMLH